MRLIIIKLAALCGLLFYLSCCYNTGMAEFENKSQASQNVQAVGAEQLPNVWQLDSRNNINTMNPSVHLPMFVLNTSGPAVSVPAYARVITEITPLAPGVLPYIDNVPMYNGSKYLLLPTPGVWEVNINLTVHRTDAISNGWVELWTRTVGSQSAQIGGTTVQSIVWDTNHTYSAFDVCHISLSGIYLMKDADLRTLPGYAFNGNSLNSSTFYVDFQSVIVRYVGN